MGLFYCLVWMADTLNPRPTKWSGLRVWQRLPPKAHLELHDRCHLSLSSQNQGILPESGAAEICLKPATQKATRKDRNCMQVHEPGSPPNTLLSIDLT